MSFYDRILQREEEHDFFAVIFGLLSSFLRKVKCFFHFLLRSIIVKFRRVNWVLPSLYPSACLFCMDIEHIPKGERPFSNCHLIQLQLRWEGGMIKVRWILDIWKNVKKFTKVRIWFNDAINPQKIAAVYTVLCVSNGEFAFLRYYFFPFWMGNCYCEFRNAK